MSARRNYGVNDQLERIANALELQAGNVSEALLDAAFSGAVDGTNTTSLFRRWWKLAVDQIEQASGTVNRYNLLCRWFTLIADAWGDKVYTLRFADYRVGSSPAMTPLADLAEKTAAPCCTELSVDSFHWTDEDPMTWYIRFNGLSLSDGTMNILSVEGIDDDFDITGNTAPVYTGYTALWRIWFTDGTYEYKTWATRQGGGMKPYAADVAPDGTHRPMHWTSTFGGSLTSGGKLTSGSGFGDGWERNSNTPAWRRSASTGITDARKMSAYEGLWSDTDLDHLLDQWQLRHFNLENSGIIEGCLSYDFQYTVAVAEENVRRVILTTAQAANLLVGGCVEVGNHPSGTDTDRNTSANYDIIACANILSIESVTIDGTVYAAVNLDLSADVTIPETGYFSTMPWTPGSTERLPGHKDGSLYNCTNGKTPARIAGVEIIDGAYAVGLDPLWNSDYNAERSPKSIYTVYQCRSAVNQAGSITGNYESVGTFQRENTGWQYEKHFAINDKGMMYPDAVGGASGTYLKSAFSFNSGSGVRAPWRFCGLNAGDRGGLAGANGALTPSDARWYGRPRLSGSGKTRGEWAA